MKNQETTELQKDESNESVKATLDKVNKLSPIQKKQVLTQLELFSGPIPHPDILKKYNEIDPGAGKQIIDEMIAEGDHRRSLENKSIEYVRRERKRRDLMGFVIGVLIVGLGAFLIYKNHVVAGSIFSGISGLGIIGLFIDKDDNNKNDNSNKKDAK